MRKLLLPLICSLLIFGCVKEYSQSSQAAEVLAKDPDAAGAVRAVRDYNGSLIDAYLKNDPALVRQLTEDGEYKKLAHMIEGMQAQNLRLESKLVSLTVDKVDRWGQDNVLVSTTEKWHYRRVNTATGAVVKAETDIEYRMNYNMTRHNGTWFLFQLTPA